ncbi:alpha/beta hydrolase [Gangjinia marincola]|uniref:Alpha/beta hydrolase n=1 Tax=Gangjinia marincola TaxID=578463 RepID=A0ABN1MHG9_9FLAO
MVTRLKNQVYQRSGDRPILIDYFFEEHTQHQPVIIFCHGYKGFKDWGCWDVMATAFAKAGFFFLKFNFSHNGGTMDQPIDFPDLDAFAQNNYTQELIDLGDVIDMAYAENFPHADKIDTSTITLIGHSRGGGITLIKAKEDSRVTSLITLASVADYKERFPKGEALKQWRENGVFYVKNGRTKQQMPHKYQFYTDFIEHEERLTISRAAKKLKIPYLIIHGTNDPTVSFSSAEKIHEWAKNSELYPIENANHVFGSSHPWHKKSLPDHLNQAIQASLKFLNI